MFLPRTYSEKMILKNGVKGLEPGDVQGSFEVEGLELLSEWNEIRYTKLIGSSEKFKNEIEREASEMWKKVTVWR